MSVLGIFAPITASIKFNTDSFNIISESVNLQNVNGSKRSRLEFATLLSQRNPNASLNVAKSTGLKTHIRQNVSAQGALFTTGRSLDLSINGAGFIPVRAENPDGTEGPLLLTRNGALKLQQVDNPAVPGGQAHYLVDSDGHYVHGWLPDDIGAFPAKTEANFERIELNPETLILESRATSQINLSVNVPHDISLLPGAEYPQTLAIYDNSGAKHLLNLQFSYTGTENEWLMTPLIVDENGNPIGTTNSPSIPVTFNNVGRLSAGSSVDLEIDFANGNSAQINVNYSNSTSYGKTYGLTDNSQNGYPVGRLQYYNISNTGIITGSFSNGRNGVIAQLALVDVANRNTLTPVSSISGPKYQLNEESMDLQVHDLQLTSHAQFNAGTLETSTIELAEVFTEMIQTQHSYSISNNAFKIINEMMQVASNLK